MYAGAGSAVWNRGAEAQTAAVVCCVVQQRRKVQFALGWAVRTFFLFRAGNSFLNRERVLSDSFFSPFSILGERVRGLIHSAFRIAQSICLVEV